jgi:hypothetical protein
MAKAEHLFDASPWHENPEWCPGSDEWIDPDNRVLWRGQEGTKIAAQNRGGNPLNVGSGKGVPMNGVIWLALCPTCGTRHPVVHRGTLARHKPPSTFVTESTARSGVPLQVEDDEALATVARIIASHYE